MAFVCFDFYQSSVLVIEVRIIGDMSKKVTKLQTVFDAPLGSIVYGGSEYVFLMVMIHCNGTATRGLNVRTCVNYKIYTKHNFTVASLGSLVSMVFICIHFLDSSIDMFICVLWKCIYIHSMMCVCACVGACVRPCVRACMCVPDAHDTFLWNSYQRP